MANGDLGGKYEPQWPGLFENYAKKYAAANHWRVKHLCDEVEDTAQQCAVVFVWCSKHHQATNDAQFMQFFKHVLFTAFVDLARINKSHARLRELSVPYDPFMDNRADYSHGPLAAALAEATTELQQAMEVIGTAPRELLELLLPDQIANYGQAKEAELSRLWCEYSGIGMRDDLISELRMRL